MASSSSSSSVILEFKYDVFLSFRGKDTRQNFTSHLYAALCQKNIQTFIDDEGLKRGDEISPMLLKTIENSKISLIILSNDYASSTWCLNELEKILECMDKNKQMVIPVFYHVDPSDVRKQTGSFKDAFVKHEERFKEVRDKVQKWRSALTKVANLFGWNSTEFRTESKLVDKVVEDILEKLNVMPTSRDYKELVGLTSRIEKIKSLLCIGSLDFRVVGIWGMGGIGKTTLADVVYNQVSSEFEGHCFITNVREESEKHGLCHVRDKVFSKVFRESIEISTPSVPQYIQERIRSNRVFVVLDDVNTTEQLEFLVEGLNQFGPGSRIVVTTRDKQVLSRYADYNIYEVKKFDDHESLQLFCIHAFRQNDLREAFDELSKTVVGCAKGNPLALRVLGCSLRGRSKENWESAISSLKMIDNTEINHVLKISYDRLNDIEKNIFLDIVCCFKGKDKNHVTKILDGCYKSVGYFLDSLVDKSLIFESYGNTLEMHDLLHEMGQEIVRQSDEKPEKRSRLCDPDDVCRVLVNNKGTDFIEGISLDMSKRGDLPLRPDVFIKMTNLRWLEFYCFESYEYNSKVQLLHGLKYLPDELRYLRWDRYSLKKLPSKFSFENIVELRLRDSKLKQLWKGKKSPPKLKVIDLSGSKYLTEIPDLSDAVGVEVISLDNCKSLVDVHPSVGSLNQLRHLGLVGCESLRSFSRNIHFRSLTSLNLIGLKFRKFPQISGNIKYLYLNETAIEKVPPSIACLPALIELEMVECRKLKCLTTNICKLKSLEKLNLFDCPKLKSFPEILEPMECLERLVLRKATSIKELPSSIENLKGLVHLDLGDCRNLDNIPRSISSLTSLKTIHISGCLKVRKLPENFENCVNLEAFCAKGTAISEISSSIGTCWKQIRRLNLAFCKLTVIPEDLCCMSSLELLDLSGNSFESLPASIKQLSRLEQLYLCNCEMLQSFPEVPSHLIILKAMDCKQLRSLPRLNASKQKGYHLSSPGKHKFSFINSFKLNENENNKMLVDAQQLIQDVATASLTIDFRREFSEMLSNIYLPGSKIPDWINHQSSRDFLTIEVSQYWFNRRFIGFALAIVIGVEEGSTELLHVNSFADFESKFEKFSQMYFFDRYDIWMNFFPHRRELIDSNLVILGYCPCHFERIVKGELKTVSFKFNFRYKDPKAKLEIKYCGASPLYVQPNQAQLNNLIEELDASNGDFE